MIESFVEKIKKYTKTNPKRQESLYNQIIKIKNENVIGDFVECGVWRGGMCMLAAYTYMHIEEIREIHVFDTFKGMTRPCDFDKKFNEEFKAINKWEASNNESHNSWCYASRDDVKNNIYATKYPMDKIKIHEGCATSTTKSFKKEISVLRLDLDFYEPTKEALINLYPRLSVGGYLIIDDYGVWEGANKAVNEYFDEKKIDKNKLCYVDNSCVYYKKEDL